MKKIAFPKLDVPMTEEDREMIANLAQFSETKTGKAAQSALRTQVSSSLADLFAPTGSTAPTSGSVTTTGTAGTTPGTQALGQALRVDPGATLGGGDQTKPQQNVWNLQSLRVKDETGS